MPQPIATVLEAAQALESSPSAFLEDLSFALSFARKALDKSRELTPKERTIFERNGNTGALRVCYAVDALVVEDLARVRNCEFAGDASVLVRQNQSEAIADWTLSHSNLSGCVLEVGATVTRTTQIERCVVLRGAIVKGCGLVSGPNDATMFGNGLSVSPGLETGGRAVRIVADSTLEQLSRVSLDQFKDQDAKKRYDQIIESYCAKCQCKFTIFMPGARAEHSSEILSSFIGRGASVSSGARLRNATLLKDSFAEQGSDVINSIMQPKSHASSQAIIKDSLICENGSVDVQGKLLSSILGPGSHLAEGEISSCLIGPMVGFHHQSMLIASFWPSGRGNVGYGANCGSNHTSRVSDQSMWPGEGVFFGLGASVKFPLNLSEAPYTVIATGVVYGPGRLGLPFSLITSDSNGCRVAPGWGFASNAYALERNSTKMKSRAPAGYASDIVRPEIAAMVWQAKKVCELVLRTKPQSKIFQDIQELGFYLAGGYCTREDLEKGINSYTKFLQLYVLRGAAKFGITSVSKPPTIFTIEQDVADTGLIATSEKVHRHHVNSLLVELLSPNANLHQLLLEAEQDYFKRVSDSKARDHVRGAQVFPPGRYDEAIKLESDGVISNAKKRLNEIVANKGKL